MGSACPSEHQLQAFQLGDLSEPSLNAVAEHLEVCPRCETRAQAMDTAIDPILGAIRGSGANLVVEPPTRQLGPAIVQGADDAGLEPSSTYSFLLPPQQTGELGRLPNYRVLRLLGTGGMAYVFLAEDLSLGRSVALKVMKPELGADSDGCQRFLREARMMASIKHDHLATVFEVRQETKVVFLAMELLEGEHLSAWLRRVGVAELPEILRVGRELATGLAAIHQHGLIHRDLKPANIWRESPSGRIKILDFGLARFSSDDIALTQPGMIVGTPAYMSPEQARGAKLGPATDLFSLGCVLYGLCTGKGPFSSENVMDILTALAVDSPVPPHELNPKIPRPLSDLVMQLLSKSPEKRPASADVVVQALREMEAGSTPSMAPTRAAPKLLDQLPTPRRWSRKIKWTAAGVAALLFVVIGAVGVSMFLSPPRPPFSVTWPRPGEEGDFLSDLKPTAEENYYFVPPESPDVTGHVRPSPNKPREIPVVIDFHHWPHGIFMHPPPGVTKPTALTYHLGGKYKTFMAFVTLNDGPGYTSSPLHFSVIGDDKELWKSSPISSQAQLEHVSVSVKGVETLKIALIGSDYFVKGAHGAWIEPYLEK
jgi:serine/threonine protein kinase